MPPQSNNVQSPNAAAPLDGAPAPGEADGSSKGGLAASTTKQLPHLNEDNDGNNPLPQLKVKQERKDDDDGGNHHAEVKREVVHNEERD